MKRLILFLATVCAVCSTLAFTACGGETALHEYTFAQAWSGDGSHHWHAATCEHTDEVSEYGEHSWDDGEETTPPAGCTSEGVKTYTCTVCERTKKERIPATGHTFAQAWSSDGSHHWHAATCGHTDEVSEYGEHSWDDGEETTPAGCTSEGVKTYTCTVCERTKKERIPATGHTFAQAWSGDGTYHWHAATCEHTDEVSEYGEHSWDDGVETTPAGCTSEGVKTYTCTVCERTKTEGIPATGHTFAQAWSGDGSHHWHAATCEHTDEVSEYGEHSWDDGVCTVCKYVGGVEALEYTLNDDGESYSVTGIGACSMEEFTIPSIYNGLPVTGIGDYAFSSCAQLKSVVVPDSVTGIGDYAFNGCHWLARVIIGNGTEKIGYSAFSGCTNLVQLVLGSGVTSIGEYAFMSCYKLVEVYDLSSLGLDAGETEHGYAAYYALNVYRAAEAESGLKEENGYLFYKDGSAVYLMGYTGEETQLILPDSYRGSGYVIYAYAFAENAAITKATISGGAVSVGANAFYRCTGLTEVALADGVSSIGAAVFYRCTALVKVSIGSGVTSIGAYAFYGCTALEEFAYDAASCADLSAYNYVFYEAGRNGAGLSVTIGTNVARIPNYLFHPCSDSYYMPRLVHVQFAQDSTCEQIGDGAFYGCTGLTEITLPAGIAQIGYDAFRGCTGLERVTFAQPEGWTVIGEEGGAVPAPDLSDPAAAAGYLTETYCAYTWRREGEG